MRAKISRLTIGIGIFIIISASFTRQLMDFAKSHIGKNGLIVLFGLVFLISGLSFLVFVTKKSPSRRPKEVPLGIALSDFRSGIGKCFILSCTIRKIHGLIKILVVALLLITGLTMAWQARILAEKMHILEYGFLGWFAGKDLIKTDEKKFRGIILACIFTAFIGILDEGFQKILPYRVFELRDIRMNILGGIWGVILYLLS